MTEVAAPVAADDAVPLATALPPLVAALEETDDETVVVNSSRPA